jgi:hypothetical protein
MTDSFSFQTNAGVYVFEFTNAANLNRFWGEIASDLGGAGIMGEHSSAAGVFTPDPGEGGREGVGNLSKDDPRFVPLDAPDADLAGGAQALHALFQAARLGDPNLPAGSIESTVGPFFVDSTHNITVTFIPEL